MADIDWTALGQVARAQLAQWGMDGPGGAIVVCDRDGPRLQLAAGLADLAHGRPFGPDSMVRLASITKHVLAAMLLEAADTVSLDETLGQIDPATSPGLAGISVQRALDMTSGLPDTRECLALHGISAHVPLGAQACVDYSGTLDLLNIAPGAELSYTNTGYRLVEWGLRARGLDFARFVDGLRARIAGCDLRAPELWGDVVPGLEPGYWSGSDGWQPGNQGMPLSASGRVCGSALGLARWLGWLRGQVGIWSRLSRSGLMADGRPSGYGLGLVQTVIAGRPLIGHGGSHPGYKSQFLVDEASGLMVVVVANREDANAAAMARSVMAAGLGLRQPAACTFADGLWLEDGGQRWLRISGSTICHMGASDTLVASDRPGQVVGLSPTAPISLQLHGTRIEGEIGHLPVAFSRVPDGFHVDAPDGEWLCDRTGACLSIASGQVIQGIGPDRRVMPLTAIGPLQWLYRREDRPWPAEVLLVLDRDGRDITLSTARARGLPMGRVR